MAGDSFIDKRRMIRRYGSRPIDTTVIDSLLTAATRAPSPHNRQPWRFALIMDNARTCLAKTMGNQLRDELLRDGVSRDVIEADVARSYERIASAPASILACLSMRDMDTYPDPKRNGAERWMAGQAVAAAIQNILLRATELGIGACWMCAPLFCQDTVVECLGLAADWEPQALITLGYAADAGKERGRYGIDDISTTIRECPGA